jgi:hypothetical protein
MNVVSDAEQSLRLQFAQHKCTVSEKKPRSCECTVGTASTIGLAVADYRRCMLQLARLFPLQEHRNIFSQTEMETADMVPGNPGIWMFHCHIDDHMDAGTATLYKVEP